jgi:hypothetical protein
MGLGTQSNLAQQIGSSNSQLTKDKQGYNLVLYDPSGQKRDKDSFFPTAQKR